MLKDISNSWKKWLLWNRIPARFYFSFQIQKHAIPTSRLSYSFLRGFCFRETDARCAKYFVTPAIFENDCLMFGLAVEKIFSSWIAFILVSRNVMKIPNIKQKTHSAKDLENVLGGQVEHRFRSKCWRLLRTSFKMVRSKGVTCLKWGFYFTLYFTVNFDLLEV